ncbi:MAG: nicotinate-nicotinamide nucleotide adenylyltransferase, partial [candidate division WOR-3 bacterium]
MPAHNSLRIGILGGLFDPPHIYHLISAQWILQEFDLKKIVFVPAYNPPHKSKYSSYIHRLRMIKMATRGNKDFLVSEVERYVKGKTYTVEVIKRLKSQQKFLFPLKISDLKAVEFYLIIGADQWNEITH